MKCDKETMRLYAVTDRAWTGKKTLYEQVEEALRGGVTCVQLREKELSDEEFLKEAMEIRELCRRYHVPFFINDNVDVAIKCGADGIHVGQDDMKTTDVRRLVGEEMIIGVSVHTVEEAREAVENGADCLGVGAMFSTTTKSNVDVLSWQVLHDICHAVEIPVVAIGGISKENMLELSGSGVDGVALVSAIFAAENIEGECKELRRLSEGMAERGVDDLEIPQQKDGCQEISKKTMPTALSIAGSDCSGGAGIQADIKTMTMHGVYAMSAITALTAQNTTGVSDIVEVTPEFLKNQLEMIFTDIRPDAVKIGMVSNSKLIETIVECLKFYEAENVVVDPVMVATSGADLMQSEAVIMMKSLLLPMATVITPNIPEAEVLSGIKIMDSNGMQEAANYLYKVYGCAVLIKGGHSINDANDLLCHEGKLTWFYGKKIENPNTHGTGCTLSSAIASNLAKGYELEEAIQKAKEYISGALADMLDLGKGSGPMNHAYSLKQDEKRMIL